MDPMMHAHNSMRTAAILLTIAAGGGLAMAVMRFTGHDRPPSWLAMVHGLLAASGLTLLLYAGFTVGVPSMAWAGTVLLLLAAVVGVYLNLAYHVKHLPLPHGVVLGHALVAAIGFVLVLVALVH